MPIRPELRHFYRSREWRDIRARILGRAKNKCEQCGKPRHRRVWVFSATLQGGYAVQYWSGVKGDGQRWRCSRDGGRPAPGLALRGAEWGRARHVYVKIGVAHLDHDHANNADENLRALCDWCHLHYDQLHHRETRATRKDAARPIKWEGAIAV